MQSSKLKAWLSLTVALAFVALGAVYIARHLEDFAILRRLGVANCVPILISIMLSLITGAALFNLFLRHYGVVLPWQRWYGLYATVSLGNTVTPFRGGTGASALYLKSVHKLDFGRFAMVLLGTYVLSAMVNSAMALVGIGGAYALQGCFNLPLVLLSLAILAGCLVAFFVPNLKESELFGWKYVVKALNGWRLLVSDRGLLWRASLLTLAQCLCQTSCYFFAYRALDLDVHPFAVLTIVSMGILGSMISLTPAALGFYDAVIVAVPTAFGLTVAQAASALLVFRGAWLCAAVGSAAAFSFSMRPETAPKEPESQE